MKTIVIAGSSGYIGRAITAQFRDAGWSVIGISRRGDTGCDITDDEQVRREFAMIQGEHGGITACIHAAAPRLVRKPLLELASEEFVGQLEVAAKGAFNVFKNAVPLLRDNGALIGITTAALRPGRLERVGSYIPAKYALRGVLRVLSQELSPKARVYAIAPGFLPGGLNGDLPSEVREFLSSKLAPTEALGDIARLAQELIEGLIPVPSGSSIAMPGREVEAL